MSWFSRTLSGSPPGQDHAGRDQDAELSEVEEADISNSSPTAKGVKEDLSELRKTFTRQLWGVASFLAPPALEKSEESQGKPAEQKHDELSHDILKDEQTRPYESSGIPRESTSSPLYKASSRPEESASEAVSARDDDGSLVAAGMASDDSLPATHKSGALGFGEQLWGPDHGLLGLRSDFAELTGSLSTGLSRFSSSVIRAVAGEDFEDNPKSASPGSPRSQSAGSDHLGKSTGLNSLLKPLFDNILTRERSGSDSGVDTEFEPWGTENDQAESLEDFKDESKASTPDFPMAIVSGISGISKLASSFLPFSLDSYSKVSESSEDRLLAVGVTNEVIAFASSIAMHPETWLDFPLAGDEEADGFQLSLDQEEHVHALELAAPSLAALRIEMCPEYMSEGRFWKIYFVLLQSRLNKEDSELLCTPQIIEARKHLLDEVLRREAKNRDLPPDDEHAEMGRVHGWLDDNSKVVPDRSVVALEPSAAVLLTTSESASHGKTEDEMSTPGFHEAQNTDRGITASFTEDSEKGQAFSQLQLAYDEGDAEEWLDEDPSSSDTGLGAHAGAEEDVSFSDLEDDDTSVALPAKKDGSVESPIAPVSSIGHSPDSPVLDTPVPAKSERLEADDWLTVNEEDVASADSS